MDGRIRTDNVIELHPADPEPGTCRSCHAQTIDGYQGHLLDCPVLTGEIAERNPNPGALVFAAKSTLRAGFNCGFLFAKSRYGGGGA